MKTNTHHTMTMNVKEAIARSESHGEITEVDATAENLTALKSVADDWVHGNDAAEFWANDPVDEDGMLWRVRLRH